jgi:hypothetical protein
VPGTVHLDPSVPLTGGLRARARIAPVPERVARAG